MKRSLWIAGVYFAAAACASGGGGSKREFTEPQPAHAPSEEEASRILAYARDIREAKGCAAAAPAYRVIAAMGEGLEPAQHELGDCLLAMTGASPAETSLFHEEGMFWLERAAFAGNARAQRALAILYGAADSAVASPADALKWALVYGKNNDAELYGYKSLPPTFVPGLKHDLSADNVAAAEAFADGFVPIKLGAYAGPPRPDAADREPPRASSFEYRQRQRRPL